MDLPVLDKDLIIDQFQQLLAENEPVECPLRHVFLKGVYIRQIFMPAKTINSKGEEVETVIVSKIHATQHPFIISEGSVAIYNKADDFLGVVSAPYLDMTEPGTRRILHILEDCRWMTIHMLPYITGEENNWSERRKRTLLERIENDIIMKREINLIGKDGAECHL